MGNKIKSIFTVLVAFTMVCSGTYTAVASRSDNLSEAAREFMGGNLASKPRGFALNDCAVDDALCVQKTADALNQWAQKQGAKLLIAAGYAPGMRMGAFATTDITPGTVYIELPQSAVMDAAAARESELGPMLSELDRRAPSQGRRPLDGTDQLMLLLLNEARKGSASRWAPYVAALPTDFQDVPVTWSGDTLAPLKGTGVVRLVRRQRADLFKRWQRFKTEVAVAYPQRFDWVSREDFIWASLVLNTRSIWWDRKRHLVPVLDMINCGEGPGPKPYEPHRTVFNPNRRACQTRARAAFKKGQQLFENYGQPNYLYAALHGFLLDNNSYDAVPIRLDGMRIYVGPRRLPRILRRLGLLRPSEDPAHLLQKRLNQLLADDTGNANDRVSKDKNIPENVRFANRLRQSQRRTLQSVIEALQSQQ